MMVAFNPSFWCFNPIKSQFLMVSPNQITIFKPRTWELDLDPRYSDSSGRTPSTVTDGRAESKWCGNRGFLRMKLKNRDGEIFSKMKYISCLDCRIYMVDLRRFLISRWINGPLQALCGWLRTVWAVQSQARKKTWGFSLTKKRS